MKKRVSFSALAGGVIGAVAMVILLVLYNGKAPMETKDLLSFVLSTVSIVIAALTVLGAVILVTTWNDIDERSDKIVSKYEEQAKQSIDTYKNEKQAELDQNAKERQEAINTVGDGLIAMGESMKKGLKRQGWTVTALIAMNGVVWLFLFWIKDRQTKR